METETWNRKKGARTEKCLRCGSTNLNPKRRTCRECKATEEYARRIRKLEAQATEPCASEGCDGQRYRMPSQWSSYCFEHHKEIRRRNQRKSLYGLTQEAYDNLLSRVGHACEICGGTKKLVVDHCHAGGQVRGILCDDCNLALGRFQDDRQRILAALDYLDRAGVPSGS